VGGRWSGLFTQKTKEYAEALEEIKPLLVEEIKKTPDLLSYLCINEHCVPDKEKRNNIDAIFIKKTGYPFFRGTDSTSRSDDNAVIITQEILNILEKNYEDCEVCDVTEDDYIDDEYRVSKLDDTAIGQWLAIIDYQTKHYAKDTRLLFKLWHK